MRRIIPLLLGLWTICSPGFAATVTLQQTGWTSGGPLLLRFAGVDSNVDGAITAPELETILLSWQTPDGRDTQWNLADIQEDGFSFIDPGNIVFFARNPEYSIVGSVFEGNALSSVFDPLLFPVATSSDSLTEAPEPGSLVLLTGCIIAAIVIKRSR